MRLLVAIPNWVGDVVLCTPALAALRARFPSAHIAFLQREYVREVLDGGGLHDAEFLWSRQTGLAGWTALRRLAREIRAARFDAIVLLTNSFRSGLLAWLAGVPRRIGFARDGRSPFLTERLKPLKRRGAFVPTPVLDSYNRLAALLGCEVTDRRLRLGITPEQQAAARALQQHYGFAGRRYAVINPGAAFGAAKCWLPERFAEVCDQLAAQHELAAVIVGAPREAPLMRRIAERAQSRPICCDQPGTTLGSLKAIVRDAALLVCNDTGPRHYGLAFGVPTLTIFGPTHQEWTDTGCTAEIKLQAQVECGPCQLRTCPLDHRCMTRITSAQVVARVSQLLGARP